MRWRGNQGLTQIEVLAASVIAAVIAGGTMTAFLTASKLTQTAPRDTEAALAAQDTLERFRNHIACDDAWFDPASCGMTGALSGSDPLPAGSQLPGGARNYTVTPADCDGNGSAGDCLQVSVTVTWSPPQ